MMLLLTSCCTPSARIEGEPLWVVCWWTASGMNAGTTLRRQRGASFARKASFAIGSRRMDHRGEAAQEASRPSTVAIIYVYPWDAHGAPHAYLSIHQGPWRHDLALRHSLALWARRLDVRGRARRDTRHCQRSGTTLRDLPKGGAQLHRQCYRSAALGQSDVYHCLQ